MLTGGLQDASNGGGWFIPFPLAAGGDQTDPERVLAELLLRGVAGDGPAELELILGGGQSLAGSSRLEGGMRAVPRAAGVSTGV